MRIACLISNFLYGNNWFLMTLSAYGIFYFLLENKTSWIVIENM